jgi:beta-galactosidase
MLFGVTDPSAPHPGRGNPPHQGLPADTPPSRRAVLRTGTFGGAALVSLRALGRTGREPATTAAAGRDLPQPGQPAVLTAATGAAAQPARGYDFNQGWLFGGVYVSGSEQPGYDDSGFADVTLPHTVTPLSWGNWDYTAWENVWIYRKHFDRSAITGGRVFVDFGAVMTNATVVLNGVTVATHKGGYLPWSAELTGHLTAGDNVLAVIVDARLLNVPPDNLPDGTGYTDYLQPGGIYRDVTLRVVPEVFICDVFAKPVNVLTPARSVEVQATIDAAIVPRGPVQVTAELLDGYRRIAAATATVTITATGTTVAQLTITGAGDVALWSPDTPRLYTIQTTLSNTGGPLHTFQVTTGFREAVFKLDGFYLNGERSEIFGLNRHQLFPYLGMAGAARLQRRDAEILKNELNCNMVRCSHYPQSPHFLDACDELGLMVWEEPPGWGYVGDAAFQDIVLQNVHDMVVRDRNRPSVIVWATRLNETANYPALYAQARQLAYDLDGSRQTTGAVTFHSTSGWAEDVFSYDDYESSNGNAILMPPVAGVPYLVSESVGALDGAPLYRWIDTEAVLAEQGRMHAQVHNIAQSDPRFAGLLAWCGIDYASISGGNRIWNNLKTPGVIDTFRVPKPGAAFYRSQVPPHAHPVILPMFFWDFGAGSPADGPGPGAIIATNCDRLDLYVGGKHFATGTPDTRDYGSLAYPLVFVDLTVNGGSRPDLRIDGYVDGRLAASLRMSADTARDRLALTVDDTSIRADGTDTTRVTFRALDAYGNQRPYVTGDVTLSLAGPATLIAENPFAFGTYGGVGGAFIRSVPARTGLVTVTAEHPSLGHATGRLAVTQASGQFL